MVTFKFYTTDHLGSVRGICDGEWSSTVNNLATYDYTPYGDILQQSGLPLDVGFTGHHWDNHIQQYFAPFRFYNPTTLRWNMRDPLGFIDGPNVYAYVGGNPVMYVDPDGQFLFLAPILGGAAIGAFVGFACGGWEGALIGGAVGAIGGLGGAAAIAAKASGAIVLGLTASTAMPAAAISDASINIINAQKQGQKPDPSELLISAGVAAALTIPGAALGTLPDVPIGTSVFFSIHTDTLMATGSTTIGCL